MEDDLDTEAAWDDRQLYPESLESEILRVRGRPVGLRGSSLKSEWNKEENVT